MTEQNFALVIKKHPDGYHYVPFDDDVSDEHRGVFLAHLSDTGHGHEPIPGTKHVKLLSGPHSHLGA